MATRSEITEIVIEPFDAIYKGKKDAAADPKGFARMCGAYQEALADVPPSVLRTVVKDIVASYDGVYWPTPAAVLKRLPNQGKQKNQAWVSVPAAWKHNAELAELKGLCVTPGDFIGDPLVAIANAAAHLWDVWWTMHHAMATRTMVWVPGENGAKCFTGSADMVRCSRSLVTKYASIAGVQIDLSARPLEEKSGLDYDPALEEERAEAFQAKRGGSWLRKFDDIDPLAEAPAPFWDF